ncbi:putative metalloprotease [Halomicronema hongdechloris C2206]|uniref:Metalloprotease n=1 Tax=Halomicronema hongdechloris C2206 TaxID=1641165 RepID=A0A1Z3HQN2_9CYAN|nr:M23 family metallopeptidase [Halomicronema hongdechloris]ASC72437.1 putative metalloprotease [Halomicronema hongdechloris C2206]
MGIRWGNAVYGILALFAGGWIVAELSAHMPRLEAAATQSANSPQPLAQPWQGGSFPVENFSRYTSPFGYRTDPYSGQARFHYGLDIATPMGSYVRSWWQGTVARVSEDTACGTSVVVRSGDWVHVYCHLQGYVVVETDGDRVLVDRRGGIQLQQGRRVKAGTRIGRVGMTGRTTGPHLHWGLKYQGTWVDPAQVLQAMYANQRL